MQPDLSQNSYLFLFESMNHSVRFERSSFFCGWNLALAKNSGSGRRIKLPKSKNSAKSK